MAIILGGPGIFLGGTSTPPVTPLLLDTYGGAAVAYSLRKLSSTYSGSAIRVRRSSDNAEQDIGFVSGDLDTSSLLSFVGANNGFITTWYDQSGNSRDAEQSSNTNQPQIVLSGSVVMVDGNPSIQFDGNNTYFVISSNITGEGFSIYTTFKANSQDPAQDGWLFDNLTSYGRGLLHDDYLSGRVTLISDTSATTPIRVRSSIDTNLNLITGIIDNDNSNGTMEIFKNSISEDSFTGIISYEENLFTQYIGAGTSSPNEVFNGNILELIVYTGSDLFSDRVGIETNINDYYSIY